MYERIVVGTDGSGTASVAVHHALALARATGAHVHLVTAWARIPSLALAGTAMVEPPPVDDGAWVGRLHDEVLAQSAGLGVPVTPHSVEEPPVRALCRVATEVGADLVVVGNRGMTGLRGRLGSVPSAVTHKAPCAVLVVPTDS